jgi:hypothetical protein
MKTPGRSRTLLWQKTAILVVALALSLALVTVARADALYHYQPHCQPRSLLEAERALGQGEPGRALSHLHRGRVRPAR